MGFLNNTSITVDAVLTKKGRELLAKGENQFNITKFALADDEVDYRLWVRSLKVCRYLKHFLMKIT